MYQTWLKCIQRPITLLANGFTKRMNLLTSFRNKKTIQTTLEKSTTKLGENGRLCLLVGIYASKGPGQRTEAARQDELESLHLNFDLRDWRESEPTCCRLTLCIHISWLSISLSRFMSQHLWRNAGWDNTFSNIFSAKKDLFSFM